MIAEPPAARAAFLSMRRELVGDPDAAKKILLANWTARVPPGRSGMGPARVTAGMPNLVRAMLHT